MAIRVSGQRTNDQGPRTKDKRERIAPGRREGKEKARTMANFDTRIRRRDRPPAPTEAWAIALDGGTTNTRAHLLRGHRVVATSQRTVGARDTVLGDRDEPGARHRARLVQAVREVVEEIGQILEREAQGGQRRG